MNNLEADIKAAAATWLRLGRFDFGAAWARYPYRYFSPFQDAHPASVYFERIMLAIEQPATVDINIRGLLKLAQAKELPSPDEVRKLRIVTAEVPAAIRPIANRGPGANRHLLWKLLWLDALGAFAKQVGKQLGGIKKTQVFDLRRRVYEQLAAQ